MKKKIDIKIDENIINTYQRTAWQKILPAERRGAINVFFAFVDIFL